MEKTSNGILVSASSLQKATAFLFTLLLICTVSLVGWIGRSMVLELKAFRDEFRMEINDLGQRIGYLEGHFSQIDIQALEKRLVDVEIAFAALEANRWTPVDAARAHERMISLEQWADIVGRIRELEASSARE